jgi:putative Holliday junction resolvase
MSIDPGTRWVGVAVADDDAPIVESRPTIAYASDEATARAIAELAGREQVGEIVVGLPIGLDGREGPSSRRARALAAAIQAASGLPVVLWDERMTSAAAHRALDASGVSARARRGGKVDRVAAVLLLEAYLEALRGPRARSEGSTAEVALDAAYDGAPDRRGLRRGAPRGSWMWELGGGLRGRGRRRA